MIHPALDDLEALLTINLIWSILITYHYSISQQHPAPIPRVQKATVDHERLYTG
jgi:hypothetical protein